MTSPIYIKQRAAEIIKDPALFPLVTMVLKLTDLEVKDLLRRSPGIVKQQVEHYLLTN